MNYLKCKGNGFPIEGDMKCHTTRCRKSPIPGQHSGAKRGQMRVVRPVPPIPLGAYRNRRSKTAKKILSSTRYLPVTWHHSARVHRGREEWPQQSEPIQSRKTETKCRYKYRYILWHLKGIW